MYLLAKRQFRILAYQAGSQNICLIASYLSWRLLQLFLLVLYFQVTEINFP